MLEWFVFLPLAVLGMAILGVFLLVGSVIWFLVALPFRVLGWLLGAVCFAVFLLPIVLLLALGAIATVVVLALPILPLVMVAGMVWLVARMVRTRKATAVR